MNSSIILTLICMIILSGFILYEDHSMKVIALTLAIWGASGGICLWIGAEGINGIGGNGWNPFKWKQYEKERDEAFDRLLVLLSDPNNPNQGCGCSSKPKPKDTNGFPEEII